ncbi:MMPL family transporter [Mycoplasmatota bacterium]|nr:MMPL family transporter [Mycoplasmatota bacterium]
MKVFSQLITKRSKIVLTIFLLLFIGALLLIPKVGINDNKADYLSEQSETKKGIVILETEFSSVKLNRNAKVLVKNKQIDEILVIKNQIAQINGIGKVIWLDDIVDLTQTPIEYIPVEIARNYLNGIDALLDITFIEDVDSDLSKEAINSINDLLEDDGAGVGFTSRSVMEVGNTATIIAIILMIIIIILFTESFFSSILMLITLGVAIVLNLGTNIVFGEISDISYIAAAVIQLAVSIDYSLIFMKNLKAAREKFDTIEEAINVATKTSFRTILAGATTTIAGFLALGVMSYQIGAELGFVLAKGVLFSLISVNILLPALMKISIKWVDKTKHRPWLPSINWLSKIINGKVSIIMLFLLITLTVIGYYGQSQNEFTYSDNQVEYTEIENEIVEKFGENNQFVLIVPKGQKENEMELIGTITQLENVKSVSNLNLFVNTFIGPNTPDDFIPESVKQQFISENYSLIMITMDLEKESKTTFEAIENIREGANQFFDESYLVGESSVIYDVKNNVERDYLAVIIISIVAVGLIILFTFKSITIPILLLLVIQTAIWINMAIPHYQGVTLSFLGYILISSIQLGATIDYAIIITENYEEERKLHNPKKAAKIAFKNSSQSIIISMMALVVAGLSLALIMEMDLIKELGLLISRGTIISGVLSLLILPQLLILFDKVIQRTTLKREAK